MNVLLFGPPGAGKGTQSAFLVEDKKMRHISSGDLFRANIKNKTPLGIKAQAFMDKGNLVPDEVTIAMVEDAIKNLKGQSFILDGFPRNIPQAKALDDILKKSQLQIDKAIFFEVPETDLVRRLSGRWTCKSCGAVYHEVNKPPKSAGVCDQCGEKALYQRPDDKLDAIKTRLKVYTETTSPLKDFYGAQGKLAPIDGTGEVTSVYDRVKGIVG